MYPIHKNSYLQIASPVDPRIINRCVDKAMEKPTLDVFDLMPPFNRVTSNQPCIPIANCDVTRRPLAFDRWALPKLLKELRSHNPCVVAQAITSVCDLVHDPERNYQAIKLHLPARMIDLLASPNIEIRERTLIALTTMANLLDAKNAIVKSNKMLKHIELCMNDGFLPVRMQVYSLLETLSSVWMVADRLVENGFVELLIVRLRKVYEIEDKNVLVLMLQTLEHLMYCSGKFLALDSDLYCLLLFILAKQCNEEVIGFTLKCISVLAQTDEGKELALKSKLLKQLHRYIFSDIEIIYENAAAAMLFATIKTEALVKACKLPNLIDRLLELAKGQHHPSTQKYCLQILTNLTGHGSVKKYLLIDKIQEIDAIYVGEDPAAKRIKEILLVDSLKFG